MRARRITLLVLLVVGICAVPPVAIWKFRSWRRADLERQFDTALEGLGRDGGDRRARDLAAAMTKYPEFAAHARVLRGAALLRQGESETAYQVLSRIEPTQRFRQPLLLLMGESLYHSNDLTEAERAFRLAATESPDRPEAHRWLAVIYHEIGAMRGAMGELQEVIRLRPDDHFAYALLGQLLSEDFERPKEAAEQLQKALERHPPPAHEQAIRRQLAAAQIALNDYAGALATLKGAQEDADVLAMRAECRWSQGDSGEARALLAKSQELAPGNRAALLLNARMLVDDREFADAVGLLKTLLEQDPHDFTSRYQLALAYKFMGDSEQSHAEFARLDESRKLRTQLHELYEKAMQRPADADVREQLAKVCEQLGKEGLATAWRRAAAAARQARDFTPGQP